MTTFPKLAAAAAVALFSMTSSFAQLSFGADCGCPDVASRPVVDLLDEPEFDSDGNLTSDKTLSCQNTYRLDAKTYVSDGFTLTIEPGTVIKGNVDPGGSDDNATALIVSRGGTLIANGTDCCPIIFTAIADQLDGNYPLNTRGEWGGVIILGRAYNNLRLPENLRAVNQDGTTNGQLGLANGLGLVEGLSLDTESRNQYGADLDGSFGPAENFINDDNSGILRYVSIRHGGAVVGQDNEINGLTLASVGSGTVLENIEIISNADDGIEFFGGSADLKYGTVMFCDDDYLDTDHGYSGRVQFFYGVQGGSGTPDNGMEMDGDDANLFETNQTVDMTSATIFNATIIGDGAGDEALECKENLTGTISNSIFSNFGNGIQLALGSLSGRPNQGDTYERYFDGSLVLTNNCFDAVGSLADVSGQGNGISETATAEAALIADGNVIANGVIDGTYTIDFNTNVITSGYNPVPTGNVTTAAPAPADDFFVPVTYKGAFKPGATPWTAGWTLGSSLGADNALNACDEDINKDGTINVTDFLQLLGAFNTDCDF